MTRSTEWLAGLLEGEACFLSHKSGPYRYPVVALTMTDKDIVDDVAARWGVNVWPVKPTHLTRKLAHTARVSGLKAIACMVEVFPYMGERRRAKIEEILSEWEHHTNRIRTLKEREINVGG